MFEGVVHGELNVPLRDGVKKEIEELAAQKSLLQKELRRFVPESTSSIILLDDEDSDQVEFLQKTAGKGTNPKGTDRGYLNDPGDAKRSHNLSSGTYTWWKNKQGLDLAVYRPRQRTLSHLALLGKRMGHARQGRALPTGCRR